MKSRKFILLLAVVCFCLLPQAGWAEEDAAGPSPALIPPPSAIHLSSAPPPLAVDGSTVPLWGEVRNGQPSCVRGIHLTAWCAGHKEHRERFESLLAETELNTLVIAVKEINGEVYLPGLTWDPAVFTSTLTDLRPYRRAAPDLREYLAFLKERGVFTIARVAVFQDQILPRVKPEWAVKSSSALPKAAEKGFREDVWVDDRGLAWTDPYNAEVQKYNINIAEQAAKLGFQGIQFDYIRFPSDGKTEFCRYSQRHTSRSGPMILAAFLENAGAKLEEYNVEISIDVFGMTGSLKTGLGIGQKLSELHRYIDVLSPMMYPSHYNPGALGVADPNGSPYDIVFRSVKDTVAELEGTGVALRPFFQDFSLGVKYTAEKVRAQIEAAAEHGVNEWLLWNPRCRYTRGALLPPQ